MLSVWQKPLRKSKWPAAGDVAAAEVDVETPLVSGLRHRPKRPWGSALEAPAGATFVWRRVNPRRSASDWVDRTIAGTTREISQVSHVCSDSYGIVKQTVPAAIGSVLQRDAAGSKRGVQGPHRVTRRSSESCGPPVTVASKEAVALARLSNWWAMSTFDACKGHSDELAILASSSDAGRGLRQIFAISAPSTLARHRGGWGAWLEFASASLLSPAAPGAGCLLDFLFCVAEGNQGSQRRSRVKSVSSVLQALRFVGGKLGCQELLLACNANCVTALETGKRSCRPPKEAVPLALRCVVLLEKQLLAATDPWDCLSLGGLLFAIWSGLRFSDLQRCNPAELHLHEGVLYGWVWRSKTSRSGFPVATIACGFTNQNWAGKWLGCLQEWLKTLPAGSAPDFLVPGLSGGSMAYSSLVALMRCCASAAWEMDAEGARCLTLHSLKRTFGAFSAQAGHPEEWTRSHCKHAPKSGNATTPKYRMDDTIGGLRLQVSLATMVADGWVPRTAVLRGGAAPQAQASVKDLGVVAPPEELRKAVFPLGLSLSGAPRPPPPPPLPGHCAPPLPASAPAGDADEGEISSEYEADAAPSRQPAPPPGPDCDVSSDSDSVPCGSDNSGSEGEAEPLSAGMDAGDGEVRFLANHRDLTLHIAMCSSHGLELDGLHFARRCRPSAELARGAWQVLESDPGSCYASCGHEACKTLLEACRCWPP